LTPAAEHSWLLLLACARSLPAARAHVIDAGWDRTRFPGVMLRGRALGIIGCGRIGQWMARYGHAFGMVCRGYDPYLTEWPEHLVPTDLRALLAVSDFVTLHVHLSDATRGLLRREHFEAMKPGAVNPRVVALADALAAEGVRAIFGIPGSGLSLQLITRLEGRGVPFYGTSHEASAAVMAGAFGTRSRTLGCSVSIRGPGVGNAL